MRYKKGRIYLTKSEYREYLQSEHWKDVKRRFRKSKLATGRCYICGSGGRLDIHHKSYKRLGKERLNDLIELCRDCHSMVHSYVKNVKNTKLTLWNAARKLRRRVLKHGIKSTRKWVKSRATRHKKINRREGQNYESTKISKNRWKQN